MSLSIETKDTVDFREKGNQVKPQSKLDEKKFSERMVIINELSAQEQGKLKTYLEKIFKKQGMSQESIATNVDFSVFVNHPEFFNYLGDFCKIEKYYLKAIKCYKNVLNTNHRNYWANFHLADIYSQHIYADKTSELGIECQTLIDESINIYDYLIAISFKNKNITNPKEEYSLRAASYFFEYIGKDSRAVFINRILAGKGILLSTEKCTYKPIANCVKKKGFRMNPFYEKFALVLEDKEIVNKYRQQYAEKKHSLKEYLIAMTPRSGSSWLAELIGATKLAGNPKEWFNYEDNLDGILQLYPCKNFSDYLKCIKVAQSTSNNVFGVEVSFPQLRSVLEGSSIEKIFDRRFKTIYLTRNNYVKQGISLYKAISSGYFHATQNKRKDAAVLYNNGKIKHSILRILAQEFFWEQFFEENRLNPLRLTYEQLAENPSKCVKEILFYLGVEPANSDLIMHTKHKKISDHKSEEMYEQFKQKNKDLIEYCDQFRGTEDILKFTSSY